MKSLRIIGCGGRSLNERLVRHWLDRNLLSHLWLLYPTGFRIDAAADGNATGADAAFGHWALDNLPSEVCGQFAADWFNNGDDAGPIRNRYMFRMVRPNVLLAFPGFEGTANMVSLVEEFNAVCMATDVCHIIRVSGDFK
jgi:hypothetical protein